MSQPEQFATYEPTGVKITEMQTTTFAQNPESLTLTWEPNHLQHVFEAELPATVDVTLFAYRENPGAVVGTGAARVIDMELRIFVLHSNSILLFQTCFYKNGYFIID